MDGRIFRRGLETSKRFGPNQKVAFSKTDYSQNSRPAQKIAYRFEREKNDILLSSLSQYGTLFLLRVELWKACPRIGKMNDWLNEWSTSKKRVGLKVELRYDEAILVHCPQSSRDVEVLRAVLEWSVLLNKGLWGRLVSRNFHSTSHSRAAYLGSLELRRSSWVDWL